ncbi:MAG: LysR family transcriptional regulator [Tateyamaria sp.]|uniref:LysR family transcriptional regulator n=1 Tax=Tateyamaria sp. TaxID=1929288 RepID=UPI00329F7884
MSVQSRKGLKLHNWDDLKLILAVSRYGTMSAAANSLGMSTATISRRLEKCAEELDQTLFIRRGTRWEPTPAALVFVKLAETVTDGFPSEVDLESADPFEERVIRASMPLDICMSTLAPKVTSLLVENPGLALDIFHETKSVAFGEVDVRVSYTEPNEGRLVRFRLGEIGYNSYVSTRLVGDPTGWVEVVDLERKPTFMGQDLLQQFGQPRLRNVSLSCAINVVHEMPLVIYLPTILASSQTDLTLWPSESQETYLPVWASYHESRRLDPDVRLMLSYLKNCFDF